jgi:hypothetical protein
MTALLLKGKQELNTAPGRGLVHGRRQVLQSRHNKRKKATRLRMALVRCAARGKPTPKCRLRQLMACETCCVFIVKKSSEISISISKTKKISLD